MTFFPFHTYNIIYTMDEDTILISKLNRSFSKGRNPSVKLLGGEILKYDRENKEIHMRTFYLINTKKKFKTFFLRFYVENFECFLWGIITHSTTNYTATTQVWYAYECPKESPSLSPSFSTKRQHFLRFYVERIFLFNYFINPVQSLTLRLIMVILLQNMHSMNMYIHTQPQSLPPSL